MNNSDRSSEIRTSRPIWIGAVTALFLVVVVAVWSVNTTIAGAVIAPGSVKTQDLPHEISHPVGGLVVAIHISDGKHVEVGDPLFEIDTSSLAAEIDLTTELLNDLLSRRERLNAVIAGSRKIKISPFLKGLSRKDFPDLMTHVRAQQAILDRHVATQNREAEQEAQRLLQIKAQLRGIQAQITATIEELALVRRELARLQSLIDRGLATEVQSSTFEREVYRFEGQLGQLEAQFAELSEKEVEVDLALAGLEDQNRRAAQDEIDQIGPMISDLFARRKKAQHDKELFTVRSPVSGFVHDLQIKGTGFVLRAGSPAVTVVPDSADLQAVLRVASKDMEQVHLGQRARLKFLAYNGREAPELEGEVAAIAPDTKFDPLTRAAFLEISVSVDQTRLLPEERREILNGMEVIAFLRTSSETPIQYMMAPISNYFSRAFRDRW